MHNQEVPSKISDDKVDVPIYETITISDWNAGTYIVTNTTDDVRFDTTDMTHPINQNYTLTN
jgi:hypothetical protein